MPGRADVLLVYRVDVAVLDQPFSPDLAAIYRQRDGALSRSS